MAAFRWGMIGSTSWADHTFGPAIARTPGNHLVAVLGSKTKGAIAYAAKHRLEAPYTNLQAFLQHPGLDAVWIASPPHLHRQHTVAALKAGLHVLCEKPMAVAPEDCKAMVRAATAAQRELCIGFNNRAHPTLQKLAKLTASGRLGDALEANVQVYYSYPSAPPAWRQNRQRSGGWAIGDLGTHELDMLCWMMNATPQAANGHLTNKCWKFKTDDHAAVSVRFKNGALGNVTACTGAVGARPGSPTTEPRATSSYTAHYLVPLVALRSGLKRKTQALRKS